jgi:hypothetical protein
MFVGHRTLLEIRMSGHLTRAAAFALLVALAGVASGCVVREEPVRAEVIAPRAPPPVRVEVVPEPTRPREVVQWEPGRWHWNGGEYVWVPGHYVERPRPEAVYVPGHWDERPNGRWVWIPAGWR